MTTIITVTNQKGGVGKTTTVIHLAHGLARAGKRVLIVDLDPQGQAAVALNVEQAPAVFNLLMTGSIEAVQARPKLDIVPGNKRTASAQAAMSATPDEFPADYLRKILTPALPQYDYLLFDTSPSVGGLQERAIWASHWIIVPTASEFMSINGLDATIATLSNLNARGWKGFLKGILPTFYDEQTRESQNAIGYLRDQFGRQGVLLSPIHRATALRECAASGQTVFEVYPLSKAADDYQNFVTEIMER